MELIWQGCDAGCGLEPGGAANTLHLCRLGGSVQRRRDVRGAAATMAQRLNREINAKVGVSVIERQVRPATAGAVEYVRHRDRRTQQHAEPSSGRGAG